MFRTTKHVQYTYDRHAELGKGSYGIVYAGHSLADLTPLAIKVISLAQEKPGSQRRSNTFYLEQAIVERLAGLNHPNIVGLLGAHSHAAPVEEGIIIMERVPSMTVETMVTSAMAKQCPLSAGFVADILRQVCLGVSSLHGYGVAHLDIKAANLSFDTTTRRVRIIDFGLAHICPDGAETRFNDKIQGTPLCMPFEALEGFTRSPYAQDIYSLGALLYWLYEGSYMYCTSESLMHLKQRIRSGLRPVAGRMPPVHAKLMHKTMSLLPSLRPAIDDVVLAVTCTDFLCPDLSTTYVDPNETK